MTSLRDEIADGVGRLEQLLEKLPDVVARGVKDRLEELRLLLLEQRPARLVLVGRRGSGKSSLINAIFGHPVAEVGHEKARTGRGRWWTFHGGLGAIDILDTRGLQEGSAPEQGDSARTPLSSVLKAIDEKLPDAVVFIVKAKEVDAAIDADIELLQEISHEVNRRGRFQIPIIGVVTHADELEPKNVKLHAPEHEDARDVEEKLERVRVIESLLHKRLRDSRLKDQVVTVHAVSSYQSFRPDGSRRADERWRIDELIRFLVLELPREARVETARLSQVRSVQRDIANTLTNVVASLSAGIAAVPIPIADIAPLTSLQVSLIASISYLSGQRFGTKAAVEFLAGMGLNVGAGFVLREATRGLLKWVFPGAGSVVSAAVAYAGSYAVGRAAMAYFIDQVSLEEAKSRFQRAREEAEHQDPTAGDPE
ncbi:MAG TPA: GTPase [Polyangiaceae bacterium]